MNVFNKRISSYITYIVVNCLLGKLKKKIGLISLFVHVACLFTTSDNSNSNTNNRNSNNRNSNNSNRNSNYVNSYSNNSNSNSNNSNINSNNNSNVIVRILIAIVLN